MFKAKEQLQSIEAIALDVALFTWQWWKFWGRGLTKIEAILCYVTIKGKTSLLAWKKSTLGLDDPLLTAQEHSQPLDLYSKCALFLS